MSESVKNLEKQIAELDEKKKKLKAKKDKIETKEKLEIYHKIKLWFKENPNAQNAFLEWERNRNSEKNNQ